MKILAPLTWFLVAGFTCGSYVSQFEVEVESCSWMSDPRLCHQYDMDLVNTTSCYLGTSSVYCRKTTVADNKVNEDANSLHIATYNVRQIPPLYNRECERERTCRIPEALFARLPTLDVVAFEELFFKGCVEDRADIARLLRAYNFTWSYQTPSNASVISVVGSGLMIASRWPIVRSASHTYKDAEFISSDILAAKGVLYISIQKKNRRYNIFSTHTQAGYGEAITNIRQEQAKEMVAFKTKMNISSKEPVIYVGDFNEDWYAAKTYVEKIFSTLNANIATKIGPLNYTFNNSNPLVPLTDKNEWLDYIATSAANFQPKSATMEAINLRSAKPFQYCSKSPLVLEYVAPYSKWCLSTATTDYLSDHYLLYGVLKF